MSSSETTASKSAQPQPPRRMSVAEFLAYPWPQETRWELIEGEPIQMVPSPDFEHQSISRDLIQALIQTVETSDARSLLTAPFDVVLPGGEVVQPDVMMLPLDRVRRGMQHFEGVPRLVVEILSPSNRRHDEVTKYRAYERSGVPEYWIVDPELPSIRIYALAESSEQGTQRYVLQASDANGFTESPTLRRRVRLVCDEPVGYRMETD